MRRVTVAVNPGAGVSLADARSLAAYLDADLSSLLAFVGGWQDEQGNPVWVASGVQSDAWIKRAQTPFGNDDRPEIDAGNDINMTGAERAFDALVIWDGESAFPQSAPGKITAIAGMNGLDALSAMGLTKTPQDGLPA